MRISIIIPTRNRSGLLERSISQAYLQNYPDLEVIVSDNNSDDSTPFILSILQEKFPELICISHKHTIPLGNHWDTVITKFSTGELIIVIPDDDILVDPEYLQRVSVIFKTNPKVGLVFAGYSTIDSSGKIIDTYKFAFSGLIRGSSLIQVYNKARYAYVSHLTAVFSRNAFDRVGGFSCNLLSPDMYLWLKIALFYDAFYYDKCVAKYMSHPRSLSRQIDSNLQFSDVKMIDLIRNQFPMECQLPFLKNAFARLDRHLYKCYHIAVTKQIWKKKSIDALSLSRIRPLLYLTDLIPDATLRVLSSFRHVIIMLWFSFSMQFRRWLND